MTVTITAYTRPSGKVVVQAHDNARKVAEAVTAYNLAYLLVGYGKRRSGTVEVIAVDGSVTEVQNYTPYVSVWKRTGDSDAALRAKAARPSGVLLRRHPDGTYTEMDDGWNDRQAVVRRKLAEARWMAERDGDHHQVLVRFHDGRVVRIGHPTRHFEWDQAIMRHEALTANPPPGMHYAMVRAENDPQWADVPWATPADLTEMERVA